MADNEQHRHKAAGTDGPDAFADKEAPRPARRSARRGRGSRAAASRICTKPAKRCCGPRPNWKTTASGPAANWTKSAATRTCRCSAICCRWSTTSNGRSPPPRNLPDDGRLLDGDPHGGAEPGGDLGPASLPADRCRSASRSTRPFTSDRPAASADKPAHTVVVVAQDGYKLHDRVVRPAQVVVSSAT